MTRTGFAQAAGRQTKTKALEGLPTTSIPGKSLKSEEILRQIKIQKKIRGCGAIVTIGLSARRSQN